MLTSIRARMATIQIWMRMTRKKHRQPMMYQRRMWMTDLGTGDIDGYEREDGDDADMDAVEEASQADDGSTQNVED